MWDLGINETTFGESNYEPLFQSYLYKCWGILIICCYADIANMSDYLSSWL